MAEWRVARSLNILLDQLNALAPRRNKASDGSIGDTNHQNRASDHNPWYGPGIVTARDFTHDPAGGLSCHDVANTLAAYRDPRVKYVIWNRRIMSGNPGPSPWVWRAYSGTNPHTSHLHLSVVASPACDSTAAWAGFIVQPPAPPPENDMQQNETIRRDWDGKEIRYKDLLLENWQNATDTIVELRRMNDVVLQIAARTANDPDITRDEIAQIVRDNSADPEVIRTTIRETLAAANAEVADDVVDQMVARLAN